MAPRDYALYFNYGSIILVLERSFYAADSLFYFLFFYLFIFYERDKEGMEYEYDSTMHALNLMPTFAHMKNYIYIY